MKPLPQILLPEEWDFSALTNASVTVQRAALQWELSREQERTGNSLPIAITTGKPVQVSPPWLKTAKRTQDAYVAQIAAFKRSPMREVTPANVALSGGTLDVEHLPALNRKSKKPIQAGESVYVVAVRWEEGNLEVIEAAFKQLAKKWRSAALGKRRVRPDDPMSDLWELSCYRLRTHAELNPDTIAAKLFRLEAFSRKRRFFDANSVSKSVANAVAMIETNSTIWAGLDATVRNRKP